MSGGAFHTQYGQETITAKPVTKSATAYRTISEAADELAVPQHVLRFWETKFNQIRPMKRSGGRRFYRPEDIELLQTIKGLLYDNGYTIKGVQRLLKLRRGIAGALHDIEQVELPEAPDLLTLKPQITVKPQAVAAEDPDLTDDLFDSIPDHLPAKPAALMATGLAEGRHLPVEEKLEVRHAAAEVPTSTHAGLELSASQRQQLGAVLAELRALKSLLN